MLSLPIPSGPSSTALGRVGRTSASTTRPSRRRGRWRARASPRGRAPSGRGRSRRAAAWRGNSVGRGVRPRLGRSSRSRAAGSEARAGGLDAGRPRRHIPAMAAALFASVTRASASLAAWSCSRAAVAASRSYLGGAPAAAARRDGGPRRRTSGRRARPGRRTHARPRRAVGSGRGTGRRRGRDLRDAPAEPRDREVERRRRATRIPVRHLQRTRSRSTASAAGSATGSAAASVAGTAAATGSAIWHRHRVDPQRGGPEAVRDEPPVLQEPLRVVGELRVGGRIRIAAFFLHKFVQHVDALVADEIEHHPWADKHGKTTSRTVLDVTRVPSSCR